MIVLKLRKYLSAMTGIMMKIFAAVVCLHTLLFSGCRHTTKEEFSDEQGNPGIKEWYDAGRVKSVTLFLNKEKTEYIYYSYTEDGRLKDSARYVNNVADGLKKSFEESTGLMHYEHYAQGVLNGPHKAVYNTGVASFSGYRKNNQMVGEWNFSFPGGQPITYEYYDSTGVLKYIRKYNEKGEVIRAEGSAMISLLPDKTEILHSDFFTGTAEVAIPPGCTAELLIQAEPQKTVLQNQTLLSNRFRWEFQFGEPGKKRVNFLLTVTERNSGKRETYSRELQVDVKSGNL